MALIPTTEYMAVQFMATLMADVGYVDDDETGDRKLIDMAKIAIRAAAAMQVAGKEMQEANEKRKIAA